jgi:anti-sigma regulatory factor (Ser/Thr protein kinase)
MAQDAGQAGLTHVAVLYRSEAEYAAAVMKGAGAGGARSPRAVLAATGRHDGLVRDALRFAVRDVSFGDVTMLGRDPARLIPVAESFAADHPGQRACCVFEAAWPGRSRAELRELCRCEALCNLALAGRPVTIVCPYDRTAMTADVLRGVELTHPVVIEAGHARDGRGYLGAGRFPPGIDQPLPRPPAEAELLIFTRELSAVRAFAGRHAEASGLAPSRVVDLVLAVGEVAANTLQHSPDGGTISAWCTADEVLVQVQDLGHISDPLAGYRHLPLHAASGHGLWLVHQVCDLAEVRTGPAGTTIRLHMSLRDRHRAAGDTPSAERS